MRKFAICLLMVCFGATVSANIVERPYKEEVTLKPFAVKEKEPVIHPNCEFFIDGKKSRLEDIKVGMEAIFTIEKGFIMKIRVFTIKKKN